MSDILKMSYWRFISLLQVSEKQGKINSGKPYVQEVLYQSKKDMIKRAEEFEAKQAKKKRNDELIKYGRR